MNYVNGIIQGDTSTNEHLYTLPATMQTKIQSWGHEFALKHKGAHDISIINFKQINSNKNYLVDEEALNNFGRLNPNGTRRHRWGIYTNEDITSQTELKKATQAELNRLKEPQVTYEATVLALSEIIGTPYESTHLGTATAIIDNDLGITLKARVIKQVYNLVNEELTNITLGNFLPNQSTTLYKQYREINEQMQKTVYENLQESAKRGNLETETEDIKFSIAGFDTRIEGAETTAQTAYEQANQALAEAQLKVAIETYELEKQAILDDIATKAGVSYVDEKFVGVEGLNTTVSTHSTLLDLIQGDITALDNDIQTRMIRTEYEADQAGIVSRLTTNESWISQTDLAIDSFVAQTLYSDFGAGLIQMNSTITQTAEGLLSKVSQTDFNALNGSVSALNTTVSQTAEGLTTKASQTDLSTLQGTVTNLETTVTQTAGGLTSKVEQTAFNTLQGTVNSLSTTVTQTANGLETKVSKTDYTGATIASLINQSAGSITITADVIDLRGAVTAEDLNITTALTIGNSVSLGSLTATGWKEIIFNSTSRVKGNNSGAGGFPEIQIISRTIMLDATLLQLDAFSPTDLEGKELRIYAPFDFRTQPANVGQEVGFCGIGSQYAKSTGGANLAGVGVNFRFKRKYAPSSVAINPWDAGSYNTSAYTAQLKTDGFWLYITGGSAIGGYYYWRGSYTVG